MESTSQPEEPPQPIIFRGKKRKFYRQRTTADEDIPTEPVPDAPQPSTTTTLPTENHDEPEALSLSDALRVRNARKNRLRGVTFASESNTETKDPTDDDDSLTQMIREEESKALSLSLTATNKRFAPQTGLSGEIVNKHMEQFIEAEIAKRHSLASEPRKNNAQASSDSADDGKAAPSEPVADLGEGSKHTALTGKLFEVDLGDEVRSRNEAMTDRARRKLQGLAVDEDEERGERPKKVRLGRDGKPWRPRNRRNSDDLKRDQLVEEVLRESRLDVYETPAPATEPDPDAEEGAADDRIAEQFRREFLDAMAERHRRRKPAGPPSKPGAKKDEEVLKGPKLGGSRNVRAAMRDLLLKKEREKDGKR